MTISRFSLELHAFASPALAPSKRSRTPSYLLESVTAPEPPYQAVLIQGAIRPEDSVNGASLYLGLDLFCVYFL